MYVDIVRLHIHIGTHQLGDLFLYLQVFLILVPLAFHTTLRLSLWIQHWEELLFLRYFIGARLPRPKLYLSLSLLILQLSLFCKKILNEGLLVSLFVSSELSFKLLPRCMLSLNDMIFDIGLLLSTVFVDFEGLRNGIEGWRSMFLHILLILAILVRYGNFRLLSAIWSKCTPAHFSLYFRRTYVQVTETCCRLEGAIWASS